MFAPGEVIFVESDQAAGYRTRMKYHVCVCGHRGNYLFINSRNWEGAFKLPHADFPALPNAESYISCNKVLTIPDDYMTAHNAVSQGVLSRTVIERLVVHVDACSVMTEPEKEDVIDGLSSAI